MWMAVSLPPSVSLQMSELNDSTELPLLNRSFLGDTEYFPVKIVQFGTGNFLKGFIDCIVQALNQKTSLNAGIVAVKLRRGNEEQIDQINKQDGLFTLNVRGLENGHLVDSLEIIKTQNYALSPYTNFNDYLKLAEHDELQWVISNTTEAGIRYDPLDRFTDSPAQSFPAKLTQLLYSRFCYFKGDARKGLRIFCCELIDNNASVLRDIIIQYSYLWALGEDFQHWITSACQFHNTLVDRIVTGKPVPERSFDIQQRAGYFDNELIETESYYQWVIETADDNGVLAALFPPSAGLNILLTPDLTLYRQRKVRILNGAHTGCVSIARLLDVPTVYEATKDDDLYRFMQKLVYQEICPTIALSANEVKAYADAILERFSNPFLHHEWNSIGLNSVSKWRARLLPVLIEAQQTLGVFPPALITSMASLIVLYRGYLEEKTFALNDDESALKTITCAWQESSDVSIVVKQILSAEELWGIDLSAKDTLINSLASTIISIQRVGMRAHLQQLLNS